MDPVWKLNSGFSGFFLSFFFSFFRFVSKQFVSVVSLLYQNREFDVSIEPKQTEDPPNSLKDSVFGYFSENLGLFWFISVCYETVLFVSVVSI
jgi:hypothetical protein